MTATHSNSQQKNWSRRSIGIVLCLSPAMLAIASLFASPSNNRSSPYSFIGLTIASLIFAALNFYLSYIRPWRLLKRRNINPQNIRHVSGIPLLGNMLVVLSCIFGFGAFWTAALGLFSTILDTGGPLWLLVYTWKDSSLWDRK